MRVVFALSLIGCGNETPTPAPPTAPTVTPSLTGVAVSPLRLDFAEPGETRQLTVQASYSDGTQRDVTRETAWSVVDDRVATISATGLATARSYGSTSFFATWQQRNVAGSGISVSRQNGPLWSVVGVVRDGRTGRPVVEAEVMPVTGEFARVRMALTDGNGYFDLGPLGGAMTVRASKFGYEYTLLPVDVSGEARLDIRLTPNTGDYVERTFVDRVVETDNNMKDYRISTRDGYIDATAHSLSCDYNTQVRLELRRGTQILDADLRHTCAPRVRASVPAGEYTLRVHAYREQGDFRVTFREPR